MALTATKQRSNIVRYTETGSANTLLTAALSDVGRPYRLILVTCAYSGAATQAGVTTTLNSGAGAGFDTTLNTGTANARYTSYTPTNDVILGDDDGVDVAAPAGGVGVTASVAIYIELL